MEDPDSKQCMIYNILHNKKAVHQRGILVHSTQAQGSGKQLRQNFWILKSWVELSLPHNLPSCPGRGGVNSTQLFGPIEKFKNLTSVKIIVFCLTIHTNLPDNFVTPRKDSNCTPLCTFFNVIFKSIKHTVCKTDFNMNCTLHGRCVQ